MGSIDQKKLGNLMKSMGDIKPNEEQTKIIEKLTDQYGNKSQEEIKQELKKLNASLKKDKEKYKKQMQAVKQLKGFLDPEQKQKLENIMNFLNEENDTE